MIVQIPQQAPAAAYTPLQRSHLLLPFQTQLLQILQLILLLQLLLLPEILLLLLLKACSID